VEWENSESKTLDEVVRKKSKPTKTKQMPKNNLTHSHHGKT